MSSSPAPRCEQPAVDGGTLQLTINRDLQWYLQQLIGEQVQDMGAKSGTIIVVEVETGKVRAAAEYPSVDPNDVDASETENQYSHIFTDPFEPGSTFKALTAATVIDAGGQDAASTVVASELGELPERRAGDATRSTTPPTPTRSPACSSTRRTRASRSSASG